jgi:acetolactate synthase I/II/III large subunit
VTAVGAAVADALADAGTEILFGVPGGGANLDLIDACEQRGIRFVLTRTETGAALMAATAAELTGRPGACVATRGPGAASLVNGVAHALLDRTPMIVVTDAVPRRDADRISHQRLDQATLFAPVTKASIAIGAADPEPVARAAVELALAPPWGPVHLDCVPDAEPAGLAAPGAPGAADPGAALEVLRGRRRPVLLAGLGARFCEDAVRAAVDGTNVPVLTTYKARGAVSDSSPNAAGIVTGGTLEAGLLRQADAIVAVGLDPVELIPAAWPYEAPVVTVGRWPADSAYFAAQAEVIGDPAEIVPALRAGFADTDWRGEATAAQQDALAQLLEGADGLAPSDVVQSARRVFGDDAIATVDAGAHMFVAVPLWTVSEPRRLLISNGLSTMGFALPAAIAATQVTGAPAVCFVGDGGLGMCLGELETLARLQALVAVVVFNDGRLSLIEIKQGAAQGGPGAVRMGDTDYAAIAAGFGIAAERVKTGEVLDAALRAARNAGGPYLIDVVIDPSPYPNALRALRG